MDYIEEDILMHYGMPKRSGRYPYGSGDNPYQHSGDFLSRIEELKKENFTYTDEKGHRYTGNTAIAKSMGLSTTQFRIQKSMALEERRALLVDQAKGLRDKGYSLDRIAKEMGYNNDSSVRSLLNESSKARMNAAKEAAEFLKKQVDEHGMIDVGSGQELKLNITREKWEQALYRLEMEGYYTFPARVPQVTNPGNWTRIKVLCPPGTPYKVKPDGTKVSSEVYQYDKIYNIDDMISHDNGITFDKTWVYPKSMNSKRLAIRSAEDGGTEKDGLIEIRPGVKDLSLGKSTYAQVRILVDGSHYLKGMAVYSNDLPDGVDVLFNSNKSKSLDKMGHLKKIKPDPDNPFGSLIKDGIVDPDTGKKEGGQSYYYDEHGKKQLSLINKRAEEGDWGEWSNKLSSQFLSKQPKKLMEMQLKLAADEREAEFDTIKSLTNPVVKKRLLQAFASGCDSAAVHLHAAALPRQAYKVIIPVKSLKDNEVYAPHCKNGETVALIRYPHGGIFEIPILKVNNSNKEGKQYIGKTPFDAIGINANVAQQLSGADFDGDTVLVIPTNGKIKIANKKGLTGLKNFEPTLEYGPDSDDPVKVVDKNGTVWTGKDAKGKVGDEYYSRNGRTYKKMGNTQTAMGIISNLITDMTLKGATDDELARAVRHSMVIIDAEKHHLDYRQSERDNAISSLKNKYQGRIDPVTGKYRTGSSTLISQSKSSETVLKRKGPYINQKGKPWYDPSLDEGSLIYKPVEEHYTDKHGKDRVRTVEVYKMDTVRDANDLVSDYKATSEIVYANFANKLKSLGNRARKEYLYTDHQKYSPSAHVAYAKEVAELDAQLRLAKANQPRERQAQGLAATIVKEKRQEYPDMTQKEIGKISQQALTRARAKFGAHRYPIVITPKQWEAIQAGAITETKLSQILLSTDLDVIKEMAMPRDKKTPSNAKISLMRSMKASGFTLAEIADRLGLSTSTISNYLS